MIGDDEKVKKGEVTLKAQESVPFRIIEAYREDDLSPEYKSKFLDWLAGDFHAREKDAALESIWDSIDVPATRSTNRSLEDVMQKITPINTFNKKTGLAPRKILFGIAAVLLPVAVIVGLFSLPLRREIPAVTAQMAIESDVTIYVLPGRQETVILPDGSTILIKGGTQITYPDGFDSERSVALDGDAFFNVVPSTVPFLVESSKASVKVMGTEFSITDFSSEDNLTVTLKSGAIVAVTAGKENTLKPGEQLSYNATTNQLSVSEVSSSRLELSTRGGLDLEARPLPDIFRSLERHFGVEFVVEKRIDDPGTYSIRIAREDTLEDTLYVLQALTGTFDYRIDDNFVYIAPQN